jgi:hypothetical protein
MLHDSNLINNDSNHEAIILPDDLAKFELVIFFTDSNHEAIILPHDLNQ